MLYCNAYPCRAVFLFPVSSFFHFFFFLDAEIVPWRVFFPFLLTSTVGRLILYCCVVTLLSIRWNMTRLCVRVLWNRMSCSFLCYVDGIFLTFSIFFLCFCFLSSAPLDQFCDYLISWKKRVPSNECLLFFQCSLLACLLTYCSSPSIKWNKRRRGLSVAEWIMILPERLVFRMIIVFSRIPMLKLSSWCSQKNK